ncbi:alpha/beta fold hydrolase [Tellurirhabdus rosea]|uniref:alpha/beta fold hydrolase n=1 Tax=Tellurirhabdus rosea TaxID=2674997 RepID=UPI002256C6B2|nr:alpha/beta hydrolase [Tellurirhabdus rosea]
MNQTLTHRYNINVSGKGTQPMLFAHGFGCDQGMWRYVAPAFEEDYKVIRFDYIGHGRATLDAYNRERYASLHGYAQDVLDICEGLDLQRVILVGHSVSSMIGLLACIQQPARFERLVMVGPSPRYLNDGEYFGGFEREDIEELLLTMESNFFGWATSLGPAIMGNPDRPELGEELTRSFCRTDLAVAQQFARVTFYGDNRKDLPRMPLPSLIIQTAEDIIAPVEVGQYIAQNTPGSRLHLLPTSGHCPHLSAPTETIDAIRSFLQHSS